jgi:Rad3-related DNA helicase
MVFKFVTFGSSDDVLWIEEIRDARIALCSAPLWIGEKLAGFWKSQDTAILTSATLRSVQNATQQGFSYIINQLGLRKAAPFTAVVPSPFNYQEAALVYVVEDMPSVKVPEYRNKLAEGLIALFSASEGRGLALFNSYRAMRDAHERIAPKLIAEPYQIRVLKQGDGLSRTEMLALLKEREKTALLGARTFWEGIDVPGANLVALAICHLPFDPPDDPILIARERAGKDKNVFFNYSLPRSILLFKQGFGRLIRTKQDYGVVVVFDSRIVNERYGVHFLRALPNPRVVSGSLEGIYDAVSEWLSRHELGQSRDAIYNSLF